MRRLSENILTPEVRLRTYQNILTCKSQNILTVYVSNENILTPQRCHRMRRRVSTGHYNAGGSAVLPSSFRESRNYTYRHPKLYLQVLQNILTRLPKYTYTYEQIYWQRSQNILAGVETRGYRKYTYDPKNIFAGIPQGVQIIPPECGG